MQVQSLDQEDPPEKEMATPPVFLLGKSHGQRSLMGHSPWGCKESDVSEQLRTQTQSISQRRNQIPDRMEMLSKS